MALGLNTAVAPAKTHAEWMATVVYRGYTNQQLSDAFDVVRNQENWKLPFEASLDNPTAEEINLIDAAVCYYTGGPARFVRSGDHVIARGRGYYVHIGA